KKFAEKAAEVYRGIHRLRYERAAALKLIMVAPTVQFLRILTHYFTALSVGTKVGLSPFMIFIPLVAFFASLPISFGGIGVREQSAAVLFSQVGLAAPQAVAFEFLAYLVGIFASLPGGIVFTLRKTKQK
ncbi:MAG: flippase-like domain-containing protein, partial [candidate division KSB1 bacterium]|nr:flippase-like domain-containing protein [candidate division KSB1 bacterium]